MNKDFIKELVSEHLSEKRMYHTECVAQLACELAKHYGIDEEKAYISAILHDIAKEQPDDIQLQTIINSDIIVCKVFEHNPDLFHSVSAYLYAKNALMIEDEEVLNAIRYHSTGRAGMSMLEKIIYISDATSYERKYADCVRLRELAFIDIDRCMLEIAAFTINDVINKHKPLSQDTLDCYHWLLGCDVYLESSEENE